jgi:hypothetical protein
MDFTPLKFVSLGNTFSGFIRYTDNLVIGDYENKNCVGGLTGKHGGGGGFCSACRNMMICIFAGKTVKKTKV